MTDRQLLVEGLVNARDLGGLPRRTGSLTPRGVFYRSENVDSITEFGWEQLREAGVRTIVDLRQPGERERDVSRRPDWLTTVEVDLDGLENTAFWADHWENGLVGTALYFLPHVEAMPERLAAALQAVAEAPPGGVLFHCMAGRDRTGLVALALLDAIETSPGAIVDDYLETVRLGDARAAASGRENVEAELEEFCARHGTSTEGAFRDALAGFDLERLFDRAATPDSVRAAVRSWRGTV